MFYKVLFAFSAVISVVCFRKRTVNVAMGQKVNNLVTALNTDYEESEEKWLGNALRDIAYYLRNHKFNEWDRRYYTEKPSDCAGFHDGFPSPSLNSIHWMVYKNCHRDFFKCITYLHSIVKTAPFTRNDDISISVNKNVTTINISSLRNQNNECKKALSYAEKTGLPFGGPKEKFLWRTSASYYMCWYTMKRNPALSMLWESCDNFASCLNKALGSRNYDPRSDDKLPFACATYSFCPDPCCPLKHVRIMSECYNSYKNPCYNENFESKDVSHRICRFNHEDNQYLEQIIQNKWNVTCVCQQKGFQWDSQFGMCVDINECITKQHSCDTIREDCLNLPGTYKCVCKWGYVHDKVIKKCVEKFVLMPPKLDESNRQLNLIEKLNAFVEFIVF